MSVFSKTSSLMLASGFATLALLQPAMALDAETFVERMTSVSKAAGYTVEFGPATLDGSTIIVDGFSAMIDGVDDAPMKFEQPVTFTNVTEYDDGTYTADRITVPDIDVTSGSKRNPKQLTIEGLAIEDFWLPAEGDTSAESQMQIFGTIKSGKLSATENGVEVFGYDELSAVNDFTYDAADKLEAINSVVDIKAMRGDFSTTMDADAEGADLIKALGLETFTANLHSKSAWTMADGRLNLEETSIDVADQGKLNITMDLYGFTLPLMDKLYGYQAASVDSAKTPEEIEALSMMMGMEMAQAISIAGASIRYDDAGLATRALDAFAQQAGVDRAQFVNTLKPQVRAGLDQLGIPALTDAVAPAVETFLDNPQSLQATIAPPNKTSILVLAAAAANPAGLIKALGLAVTANQ